MVKVDEDEVDDIIDVHVKREADSPNNIFNRAVLQETPPQLQYSI